MFKKTIEFEDFDGNKCVEDFYFHISMTELAAMAHGADELAERVKKIQNEKNGLAILHEFREIVRLACGRRSEDNKRFIKTPETQSDLLDSPAFDVLVMEMMSDPKKMAEFVSQLFPEKVKNEMLEKYGNKDPFTEPPNPTQIELEEGLPDYQKEKRKPTMAEFREMSQVEQMQAWAWLEQNGISL